MWHENAWLRAGRRARVLARNRPALLSVLFLTVVLVVVLFPKLFTAYGPYAFVDENGNPEIPLERPTQRHPFGTDELGRDILSRVVYGTRISLGSGAAVIVVVVTVGTLVGMIAASRGGMFDELVMRISDVFQAFPPLIIAIVFIGFLGPSLYNGLMALALIWWPQYARLARGVTLSTLQSEYVGAARAVGAPGSRVLWRHVLPNSVSPTLVKASLDLGQVILIIGALSFLGLGVQPPTPELGALVTHGRRYILTAWWYSTFPGMAIFLIILALNFLGDGIRDILDPMTFN